MELFGKLKEKCERLQRELRPCKGCGELTVRSATDEEIEALKAKIEVRWQRTIRRRAGAVVTRSPDRPEQAFRAGVV